MLALAPLRQRSTAWLCSILMIVTTLLHLLWDETQENSCNVTILMLFAVQATGWRCSAVLVYTPKWDL